MGLMLELQPSLGPVLVVGGGNVALRKARAAVEAGFEVTVVAPAITADLLALGVRCVERPVEERDLDGAAVVFACTDDREVNRAVGAWARARRIPVVVADSPEESTAFSPAVHRDGDLVVGVSTNGASPELAQHVRDRIAAAIGTGWASRVERARRERQRAKRSSEEKR